LLAFDPTERITVTDALEHPWLASYHDVVDEPECPTKFEGWRKLEELETLEEFREALWKEIEDYRKEVRGINIELTALPIRGPGHGASTIVQPDGDVCVFEQSLTTDPEGAGTEMTTKGETNIADVAEKKEKEAKFTTSPTQDQPRPPASPIDPVVTYARRSSFIQPSRQASTYNSPLMPSQQHLPTHTEGHLTQPGTVTAGGIVFPTQGYVVPARSRTTSMAGGEVTRKLLRTLSTVSVHESAQGLAGGLADIAPIGKYIVHSTAADAPPSEMPRDFAIKEASEGEEEGEGSLLKEKRDKEKKEGRFPIA
jgi:hypothetical protein